MISLWTDLHIANAAKNVKNVDLRNKINYLPFLLEKYNVDSARFMQSNIYYVSKAEDYKKMFKKVEENLIELRDKYDPISAGIDSNLPEWKKDSIKRSRRLDSVIKNPKKLKDFKADPAYKN